MRYVLIISCLIMATHPLFAQNLSRAAIEASYFHVEDDDLESGRQYLLVEMEFNEAGTSITEKSFPELDHWAWLLEKNPEYSAQIVVHGSTLDAPLVAQSKTEQVALQIKARFERWGVSSHRIKMIPLGREDPQNTQPSIDSIYKSEWKPLAHQMNARAYILLTKEVQ